MLPLRRLTLAVALLSAFAPAQQPTAPVTHPAFPTGPTTPLGSKIAELLADPAAARAHWGIAVTALDGTPIYGLDEGKLFRPASNAKIYTTIAAMALLGPDSTFDTRIFGKLDPIAGTVNGDLVLLGGGDPSFASNDLPYMHGTQPTRNTARPLDDLESLADQLQARGVKHITGNIVGDDTLFPYEPYAESWAVDDLVWGYGAPVSALTIHDNQLRLVVTLGTASGAKGHESHSAPTAQLEQFGVPYYTLQTQVEELAAGSRGNIQVERTGPRTLRIFGGLASGSEPDVEEIAIADPAEFAALALRGMLQRRGIFVDGEAKAKHRPAHEETDEWMGTYGGPCGGVAVAAPRLASHTSAPLTTDVVFTNKTSQNLHAELLLHELSFMSPCGQMGDGSIAGGTFKLRNGLASGVGLDHNDLIFYDGSGLSAKDLVAPRATAKLLSFATTQPWFSQWKASLPIGGVDGSLEHRFTEAPLKGHVFAKTGTLGESRALSGYLDCASGRQVIFSIMVDNHLPGTPADRTTMDKIIAAIAATQ